jgi:hypothetical protein
VEQDMIRGTVVRKYEEYDSTGGGSSRSRGRVNNGAAQTQFDDRLGCMTRHQMNGMASLEKASCNGLTHCAQTDHGDRRP